MVPHPLDMDCEQGRQGFVCWRPAAAIASSFDGTSSTRSDEVSERSSDSTVARSIRAAIVRVREVGLVCCWRRIACQLGDEDDRAGIIGLHFLSVRRLL